MEIVLAHHRAGASARAAGEVSLLHEDYLTRSQTGQVHGDAGSVDAAADDDYVCRFGGHGCLSGFSFELLVPGVDCFGVVSYILGYDSTGGFWWSNW